MHEMFDATWNTSIGSRKLASLDLRVLALELKKPSKFDYPTQELKVVN